MTFPELMQQHGIASPKALAALADLDESSVDVYWYGKMAPGSFSTNLTLQIIAQATGLGMIAVVAAYYETRYTGWVYLMSSQGRSKIGHSRNPEARRRGLLGRYPDLILLHQIATNSMRHLEQQLQARFAEYRVEGEWFQLSAAEIDRLRLVRSYRYTVAAIAYLDRQPRPEEGPDHAEA